MFSANYLLETLWVTALCSTWLSVLVWGFTSSERPLGPLTPSMRQFLLWLFILPVTCFVMLVIPFFQVFFLLLRFLPFRERMRGSMSMSYTFWEFVAFVLEFFPDTEYQFHFENMTSDESLSATDVMQKVWRVLHGHNIMWLGNHADSELDWLAMVVFSGRFGLGTKAWSVQKVAVSVIPGLGWISYLGGAIPLWRNATVDFPRLKKTLPRVASQYPTPWSFIVYPEGTRQTPQKLKESQEWAKARGGLKHLSHLLQPRTKGFVLFMSQLRQQLTYVVDLTCIYEPSPPHVSDFSKTGYLHDRTDYYVRYYKVSDLPTDDEELTQWLYDMWAEKDQIVDKMKRGEYRMTPLGHSPMRASLSYITYAMLFVAAFRWYYCLSDVVCLLWALTALFPVYIVFVQYDERRRNWRRTSARRKSIDLKSASAEDIRKLVAADEKAVFSSTSSTYESGQCDVGSDPIADSIDEEFGEDNLCDE